MDRYKAPSPEDISTDEVYSFSYNPKDQPLLAPINHRDVFGTNLQCWMEEQKQFFTRLKHCEVDIVLEISKNGRFHFHGYINIKDIARFYASDIRRLQVKGSYEIDIINDPEKWREYVSKQFKVMFGFCEQENIEYRTRTRL